MSELQKRIARIGRRESTAIGFASAPREKPRAILLGAIVADAAAAKAAADAGVDAVIVEASNATAAAGHMGELKGTKSVAGALLPSLDEAGADALVAAGCDFVICTLEGTDATAVDTDRMGHVAVASNAMDDTTLRALAPLGLDALFVVRSGGAMTLANQLELVRLASFAGAPLLVTTATTASVAEVRALRDGGTAMAVAPAGATPEQIATLSETLQSVPPSKKGKSGQRDIALVPSVAAAGSHEHDEEDGGDDE